jgi:F-type H+-transporting ATPase subunit b
MHFDWWTLGIQTVNVAVLVWLLQRFFWRPIAATIAQRRASTAAALAEAKAVDDTAKAALAEVEKTRAGFAAEHAALLQQAQDESAKLSTASLATATRQVAEREAAGRAAMAAAQNAAAAEWANRSLGLAIDIAGRLAARLDGPAVQASFLSWLLDQLRGLPESARRATEGAALEVIAATDLDQGEQARITGLIATALGTTPALTFRTDKALIAGLELHGPHLVVANSWQADLARIHAEVTHAGP